MPGQYLRHAKAQRLRGLPQNLEWPSKIAASSEYLLYRCQHGCCKNVAKSSKDARNASVQVSRQAMAHGLVLLSQLHQLQDGLPQKFGAK